MGSFVANNTEFSYQKPTNGGPIRNIIQIHFVGLFKELISDQRRTTEISEIYRPHSYRIFTDWLCGKSVRMSVYLRGLRELAK